MLKKHTKHTGHTQLQLDYHYKTADFKKSKGEKNSFEKSQDSRRVLVYVYVCIWGGSVLKARVGPGHGMFPLTSDLAWSTFSATCLTSDPDLL